MDRLQFCFLLSTLTLILHCCFNDASSNIGVNYGLLGNNLPPPADVISLFKQRKITKLRLFDPNPDVLNALRNSGIQVVVGMKNQDLAALSTSQDAVNTWFANHIDPYKNNVNITTIAVGNEVIPGELGSFVLPVLEKLHTIITTKKLSISLSTSAATSNLAVSYPPSKSSLTDQSRQQLVPVAKFLSQIGSPLLINVYPCFAYFSDPKNIRLDYAVFEATSAVVQDGSLSYYNMFDAMVDAFDFALEKEQVANVSFAVSETGWPSAGNGELTTPEIAQKYNQNVVKHLSECPGTPKRPNKCMDGFIFAMFNENQKPEGVEQNFGLHYPNKTPVYQMSFEKQGPQNTQWGEADPMFCADETG